MKTPLNENVLEDTSKKNGHVKDFKVALMNELPNEVRCSFVEFATLVIEQHQSQMTDIDFQELIRDNLVTSCDERLAVALAVSSQT